MSVQNPDKVVTKQDLADFYQELLPYLGGNLPVMGEINKSDIYDTTEKVVGKSVDGKPLYQSTFTGTFPSSMPSTTTIGTISNLEKIYKLIGGCGWKIGSDVGWIPISLTDGRSISNNKCSYTTLIFSQGNNIQIQVDGTNASYMTSQPYVVTIQYTKTTDAANSYNYADENDYSTTEKIVGTWIDGKPLYQKTFTGTTPSTSGEISTGISATKIIDFKVLIYNSSGYSINTHYMGNATYNVSTAISDSGAKLFFSYGSGTDTSAFKNKSFACTVQYTKT